MDYMADVIWGKVISSMQDGAFGFWVSRDNPQNLFKYAAVEKIKIVEIDTPEYEPPIDPQCIDECKDALLNRGIRCEILAKDKFGRLVCRAYVDD
jgi:endonuclease YncB( thermonuclease family)